MSLRDLLPPQYKGREEETGIPHPRPGGFSKPQTTKPQVSSGYPRLAHFIHLLDDSNAVHTSNPPATPTMGVIITMIIEGLIIHIRILFRTVGLNIAKELDPCQALSPRPILLGRQHPHGLDFLFYSTLLLRLPIRLS